MCCSYFACSDTLERGSPSKSPTSVPVLDPESAPASLLTAWDNFLPLVHPYGIYHMTLMLCPSEKVVSHLHPTASISGGT